MFMFTKQMQCTKRVKSALIAPLIAALLLGVTPETYAEEAIGDSIEVSTRDMRQSFYLNVGYSFVTSKFYMPADATGHPKHGLDWQAGYDWVSKKGYGFGLMYSGYKSSYNTDASYGRIKVKMLMTYIAPQFVVRHVFGRWELREHLGVGYFRYTESADDWDKGVVDASESLSGIGYNFMLGVGYSISKSASVGADLGYIVSSLPEQDGVELADGERSGISRIHLNIGMRWHF